MHVGEVIHLWVSVVVFVGAVRGGLFANFLVLDTGADLYRICTERCEIFI